MSGWNDSSKRAPTADDAQFGMVYVYYPDGHLLPSQAGDYAEATRWEHVADEPTMYPWWHALPAPTWRILTSGKRIPDQPAGDAHG